MKNKVGILPIVLFAAAFILYIINFSFGYEMLPGLVLLVLLIVLPITGMITSLKADKRAIKFIGFAGNGLIFLIAIVIPFVVSLFWNSP